MTLSLHKSVSRLIIREIIFPVHDKLGHKFVHMFVHKFVQNPKFVHKFVHMFAREQTYARTCVKMNRENYLPTYGFGIDICMKLSTKQDKVLIHYRL